MITNHALTLAVALATATPVIAQHEEHAHATAKVEKPVVFLDKNPRIVAYQLGRLSNEQLLLVDRDTSDAKYVPVYQAILVRAGMAAKYRQEAAAALAKLNKTSESVELLAAIRGLDLAQTAVLGELAKLLVTRKPEGLKTSEPALEEVAGAEGPAAARRSAFAALAAIQTPEALWSVAQDKPAGLAHLLAAIPLVPDPSKRAAFFARTEPLLKPGGDDDVRRAAIAAVARMPGHEVAVFRALSQLIASDTDVPDCARALAALPKDTWPADGLKGLADALLESAKKIPEPQRTETDFLDITQLGTQLAAKLPKEMGIRLRKAFHSLGVNVLRLRTLPEQMFYDKTLLVVEAGKPVELIFENPDAMQHNWVVVLPGALEEIGLAADKMVPVADSQGRTFVPASPKVLLATKLLNAGESTRLRFTAPSQPDKYPYACTFPGHWQRMRGTLLVVKDLDEYLAQPPSESDTPTITEWKLADLAPELSKLASGRSFEKGKELFSSVGCIACHRIGGLGTAYGPDLNEVFAKYKGSAEAVLAEILDPSKNIEPRYRPYSFTPANGEDFTGLIVKAEGDTLFIQTGPGDAAIQKFTKKDIKSREPQASSLMPSGLLNLLNKEQILDLLTFLQSGGNPKQAASAK